MMKSIEEINKVDEEFQEDMEDLEGKMQWKIGPSIRGYQIFKEGKYSFTMDAELEDADVTMIIKDVAKAKEFFSGELDGTTAFMSGDLEVEGNLQVTMQFSGLAEYIEDYLEPIRPS